MCSEPVTIGQADDYEATLARDGRVIASFAQRRESIVARLDDLSQENHAIWVGHANFDLDKLLSMSNEERSVLSTLLDEVTGLVEWPEVYVGEFEKEYLDVPQECLILTMQQNQKYFPLLDASTGKLLNKFLIVSNMQVTDPHHIIEGNQRVVRPRLSDARFFFNQDRKQKLESRVEKLGKVVYHNKLGSQLQRVERITTLAGTIARLLQADKANAELAARLCKADLITDMVGEFPELQGIIGRYYAFHDGEELEVANAIEAHYHPRFAGDSLPHGRGGVFGGAGGQAGNHHRHLRHRPGSDRRQGPVRFAAPGPGYPAHLDRDAAGFAACPRCSKRPRKTSPRAC